MLKTGFKSFVYSFSVSLFAITIANKAFLHKNKETSYDLNIQNKSIALYLADTKPSYIPVKKIALNSLPDIQKQQALPLPPPEPEIIVASNLEPLDIPLEIVKNEVAVEAEKDIEPTKQELALANVLYAPEKPLPMPEIKAEPVYQGSDTIEVKVLSAPKYASEQTAETDLNVPQPLVKQSNPPLPEKDNSLLIARNDKVDKIPLIETQAYNGVNKVQLGDPSDLQHVAFANNNVTPQSLSNNLKDEKNPTEQKNPDWQQMPNSPWVTAKSTGSKNLFINKSTEDFAELVPAKKNDNGVLIASETAKNLIIPIPEDILKQEDITPQLAYPPTSEDKKKEIDINLKIKKAAEQQKNLEAKKDEEKASGILTPIEEDVALEPKVSLAPTLTQSLQKKQAETEQKKEGFMSTLSSIFSKTKESVSQATDNILEKAKVQRTRFGKKRFKSKAVTILPAEIRLAFQPNRAEISGQTLRWIQAFATKTAQTSGMTLEIRIDGASSTKLQQNRLNLLYNILLNKGVDYSMIKTVFTERDPNSFILRTIASKTENNEKGVKNQKHNRYIQW